MPFNKTIRHLLVGGIGSLILLTSCESSVTKTEEIVPTDTVATMALLLIPEEGLTYLDELPYTGYALQQYANGERASLTAYLNGKKHGTQIKWFEDGDISAVSEYHHGKLEGTSSTWWRNGNLRTVSAFSDGVAHGTQRQYYESGALFKEINLDRGIESGMQRSWRENGKIYNNYEARDGRIYGLKRSKLCFKLEDEKVVL